MSAEILKYKSIEETALREIHVEDPRILNTFVCIGDKKWICQKLYVEQSEAFRKFKTKPSDVWVISFQRSGTTWTQEMVWLLRNNLDYDTASRCKLDSRFPFFDASLHYQNVLFEEYHMSESEAEKIKLAVKEGKPSPDIIALYPSPKCIKSHLPFFLLPEDLFESGCKIVYVARNPKDAIVSAYHIRKNMLREHKFEGDFKDFWNLFKRDLVMYAPYWEHLKEAWKRRNDPNFLFIFYEEMYNDLPKVIDKVAKFLGKSYSSEEMAKLADHLNIKNFKNNTSVNKVGNKNGISFKGNSFVRKGQAGAWRSDFTPELEAEADQWIKDNLKDTDLRFPIEL